MEDGRIPTSWLLRFYCKQSGKPKGGGYRGVVRDPEQRDYRDYDMDIANIPSYPPPPTRLGFLETTQTSSAWRQRYVEQEWWMFWWRTAATGL